MEHKPKTPYEGARDLIRLLVPDWRPTLQQRLWMIRGTLVLGTLVLIGYVYDITLWDWLKLLIVPAAIAGVGLWFNRQLQQRNLEATLAIEDQRSQDAALKTYEDQMGTLLLDRNLRSSARDSEVRDVARLHTLSALRKLDRDRKRQVVQFLWEWNLITYTRQESAEGLIQEEPPIVSLYGADLTGANLSRTQLSRVDLRGAQLVGADLSGVGLNVMHGSGASLLKAMELGLSAEETMKPVAVANLVNANLSGADMRNARLLGVDLTWANLSGADLSGAKVTHEQLGRCDSLEGATMPDGRKYEDWLTKE